MNFWKRLFDKKQEKNEVFSSDQTKETNNENETTTPVSSHEKIPASKPLKQETGEQVQEDKNEKQSNPEKRSIRVFISSTFRDMMEERDAMISHTWPELRRFCRERQVELVEIDLRWGIAEEQTTRKETLKLCLDEIRACRPFFIGLLGERYGWVPDEDAFTADLMEEQPWLEELNGKSVTELEILHGVLNNPEMAGRAFFYFRDPEYAQKHGVDFLPENEALAKKQSELKELIRATCAEKSIPLNETYADPATLAPLVLEQLKDAIDKQFPKESIPNPLDKEAKDHDAFAEIRRRTYIGRPDYFDALDRHVIKDGAPLGLLGDSGSGKSALLANWIDRHRKAHPKDIIFQHYIGGTSDSAVHWKLMTRLMSEIKRWTDDPDEIPKTNDEILRDFPLWLSKARIKAERDGIRFIVIMDALNQLEDKDHGRLLGWLPEDPFTGALRLIVSTLPGDTLDILEKRTWQTHRIQPLTTDECQRMTVDYLKRFGKKLDDPRLSRLANSPATYNPLYLKVLLDELRVTGTHDRLDERLDDYLSAEDIPGLLSKVLTRYQKDYEDDRKDLVKDALGSIWTARRGLSEAELLELLKPDNLPQLPLATWAPLRAALEDSLVDRGGILNFAHDFLSQTVETAFLPDLDTKDDFRIKLADYFEVQPITARSCDELPWLLWKSGLSERLRNCILDINCFLEIYNRDRNELPSYWIFLKETKSMGKSYLESFNAWLVKKGTKQEQSSYAANLLGLFLHEAALHKEAEPLYRLSLQIKEEDFGKDHPNIAINLNNLASLLLATNRLVDAEPLYRRALKIDKQSFGKDHPNVARDINNLAQLLQTTNRLDEAELYMKSAIEIYKKNFGENHPDVATSVSNLAGLFQDTNRLGEAEPLYRRALQIDEQSLGKDHPYVATCLNNLARLLQATNRLSEAEPLYRRSLKIDEQSLGKDHPDVAIKLNNLAQLLQSTNRLKEAEPLIRRALQIDEQTFGKDHPNVAVCLNNLAGLLKDTNRLKEAELMMRRALEIDEQSFGKDHPNIAKGLNNIALLLEATNRLVEAEPLMRRSLQIDEQNFGKDHPNVANYLNNLAQLLQATNRMNEAEPLIRRALKINEQSFGKDHPEVARSLNILAVFLQATNRMDEVEPLYKRALKIDEQSFGKDHPDVARDLNNLAQMMKATNRLVEAEPLMKRALQIDEQSFGKDHPKVAIRLNNLAQLLKATNRLKEAELMMRRALEIDEQSLGKDHLDVATDLNNLAHLFYDTNRLDEAEKLYKREIAIFEKSLGKDHPKLAISLNNYAQLLQATNRLKEAEPLMKRVVDINEKSYGNNHIIMAASFTNLALLYQNTNRLNEAEPLLKKALEIDEQNLGKDHPDVASNLSNLSVLLMRTNRLKEAEPLMKRALEIDQKTYGNDHPNVARDLNNLAQIYKGTNRLRDAEPLVRKALEIDQKTYGNDHPNVAIYLNSLSLLLADTGRINEAEPLMRRHLEIFLNFKKITGHEHPHFMHAVDNYAGLLQMMGQTQEQIEAHLTKIMKEFYNK